MRKLIKQFVQICSETLPIQETIYEFGSLRVLGQEKIADLRPFFKNKKFIGADMRPGVGVDIVLNLHKIDLPSSSVGTVIIVDTLEHVEYPRKAVEEAYRILKPNGLLIISSVMNFQIHDHPYDYWRFTPEAFKSLLKPFASSFVGFAGDKTFPHTVVGIGFKNKISDDLMNQFLSKFKTWQNRESSIFRSSWKELIRMYTPPIILRVYRKILNK
ncbi:MAG: class I SAM-dependent methyltransferase [Patescibacteria group bacterium]|jgi:SAM-dependent methyltransferase